MGGRYIKISVIERDNYLKGIKYAMIVKEVFAGDKIEI